MQVLEGFLSGDHGSRAGGSPAPRGAGMEIKPPSLIADGLPEPKNLKSAAPIDQTEQNLAKANNLLHEFDAEEKSGFNLGGDSSKKSLDAAVDNDLGSKVNTFSNNRK